MQDKINRLKSLLADWYDLSGAAYLLEWDQQTYMPPKGITGRGQQIGTLRRLAHEVFTSDEVGRLLEDLMPYAAQLHPDSFESSLVRVTARRYEQKTRVPPAMVSELGELAAAGFSAWHAAKAQSDFSIFQPHLERIVEYRRRYAALYAPYDHIYDPLLDYYEPGMKTAEVQAIFSALRPQQVRLLREITSRPQVDDSFLRQDYPEQQQWDFGAEVITRFGYDWQRGRQDRAAHPFTVHIAQDDVRITTRFLTDYGASALFSTMHEAGHAMYDMGVDRALDRTPLTDLISMALHESQSRMWENLVGRSLPFWEHFYPRLQAYFPEQLGNVDLMSFYKGINQVQPSLIRVEADEATYNLHIMLRMELEIALMEGSLEVKDLPEAWNARMQDYLGITPPDDAHGVLQDVHWADGYFGYFPTYALGNLVSVQLWERIQVDIPGLNDQIRSGEFSALLGWLVENVHCHGSKLESQELVRRITGTGIDPAPYMRYLREKYSQIYGL